MAEAILQKVFKDLIPKKEDEKWQDWLIKQMSLLRKAMLEYPDGGRVVAGAHLFPALTLAKLFETTLVSLTSAKVDLKKARHILMTVTYYTFGYVIEEQSSPTEKESASFKRSDILEQFPNFAKAVSENRNFGITSDEDFLTGLQYIIKGAESNN
jgi:TetR/AcrR family tetracycline transcriptional repressor